MAEFVYQWVKNLIEMMNKNQYSQGEEFSVSQDIRLEDSELIIWDNMYEGSLNKISKYGLSPIITKEIKKGVE